MTMKSPGWAGMAGLDARLFGIGVRAGGVAARRADVILGLDTIGDEPRGVALFTGALFAVALTGALFAVALAVAFFAVAFFAVAFFAGTVPSPVT
jgi:hypothetical protein